MHKDTKWIESAVETLLSNPTHDTYLSSRNLWNLYALDFKSEIALEKFSQVIQEADGAQLSEIDIANAIRAFAHFQYVNYECIESLLKQTIKRASEFKL